MRISFKSVLVLLPFFALLVDAKACTTAADCGCPAGQINPCGGATCFNGVCQDLFCGRPGTHCPV
ncbi:hypothetical protein EXIGLDRAFT_723257, partial [Exidia glandulosa HHB12029]